MKTVIQIGIDKTAEFISLVRGNNLADRYVDHKLNEHLDTSGEWTYHGIDAIRTPVMVDDPPHINFHVMAIMGHDGDATIQKFEQYTLDGIYHRGNDTIDVKCLTLETFINQVGIKTVDLLAMDIEGYESEVLQAFTGNNVRSIFVEHHNISENHPGQDLDKDAFIEMLVAKGYELKLDYPMYNGACARLYFES